MTDNKDELRAKAGESAALPPEDPGALPPGEARKALRALRARLAELEARNLELLRTRAPDELRRSESKYRALVETTGTGYLILDFKGRVLDANGEYVRLSGHKELREILGRSVIEWTAEYEKARNAEAVARCLKNGSIRNFVVDYMDPGGRATPVEINATVEGKGEEARIISLCRDLSGRRRAEQALRDSENRYRTLFENMLNGFAYCRMIYEGETPADFVYLAVNAAFEKLTGLRDVTGKKVTEVIPGIRETDGELFGIYGRVARTGKPETFETWLKSLDMWFSISVYSPARDHFVAIFDVITERKRAEADRLAAYELQGMLNAMLHQSLANLPLREKLSNHLATLLAAPWLSPDLRGSIFLVASGRRELVLAAHQGLTPSLLAACAIVPVGRCLCGKAAETGRPVFSRSVGPDHHITYEGMTPHGHYCAPITAGGKVLGVLNLYLKEGTALTNGQERFVAAATDVMAENILHSQVEDRFSHAQKMEAVGLLAGGVAHDFNNILTAVAAYAEFIRRDLPPGNPGRDDAQEILDAADRAAALTRQLLAFGRRQIMAPRVVDLNKVVGGLTNMLKRLIGENIKLTAALSAAPCPALLDPNQLEQVIMNLAVNARDAMPGGGGITLETGVLSADKAAHPEMPPGPLVRLRVRDTGCGMTAEIKSRAFEPFFTTKEPGKGTGLGLSTVFGIVKQSAGEITVESEPAKGTVFNIYFPLAETVKQDEEKDREKHKDNAARAKGRETVLFVEDEESLLRLGVRILAAGGYTVLAAAGGAEALEALERYGKPVDLLLTDVVMPGMSGRELALEVARRGLAGRILYMSGYTDDAIVKHGVLEPGLAFIYKPFTPEALAARLREVLDGPADRAKA